MNFYTNQNIIFDLTFDLKELTFIHSKRLNDSINDISILGNEDIYYEGEKTNEPIDEKFNNLTKKGGWIHFENGTSYKIKQGRISEIKLDKQSLGSLTKLDSKFIERKIGKPSKIEHDIITYVFDSVNDGDIYYYLEKSLSIQFDPDSNKLKEIRIK